MTDRVLHVLHAADPATVGGAELFALRLMHQIPRDLHCVAALVIGNSDECALVRILAEQGIPYSVVREVRRLRDIGIIRATLCSIQNYQSHLLHVHNGNLHTSPYLPVIAQRACVRRILVTEQSNHPQHPPLLGRWRKMFLGRLVTATVAVSGAIQRTLLARYRFPRSRVHLIPNGVDIESISQSIARVDKLAVRNSLGLPPDALVVGTVANFRPEKGHTCLLQAIPSVIEQVPNARFVLAGDGELRPSISERIREMGLSHKVLLTGWCSDVARLLAILDVFVLPSFTEGMPLSVLEAMAAGLPVAASAVGGVPELISHHETGVLVEPGDVRGLSSAITELLLEPDVARRLGENAKARVVANYRHRGESVPPSL